MKHPLKFVSALLLLPQVALAQAPDTHPSPVSIICDGSYGGHLQGLATDGAALFWSHTVQLVKTDLKGKKLQRIDVASHHGDLTYHDGKVFVAVELGQFNQSPGSSDPWVYVYDADDLKLIEKNRLPELVHGCGGIAYHNGKFAVVGGLPGNHQENYIYEYDEQFRFVDRHLVPSGQTKLGIQTAAHIDGHWWFGCYGSPANPGLLKVDEDFKLVGHSATDFSFGIVRLNADTVLRGECFDKSKRGKAELLVGASPKVQSTAAIGRPPIEVADGFEVSVAAAPPLVGYPMMACLDDRGRLYIAESDGRNLTTKAEIEKELPRFVRRLEDVDGDGIYDRSTIFADKMTMPEGGLWHDGALYIISAPYLWRLEDTDDDGVADKREKILGYMEFDGRANQHGPYFGPNGRLYFTGGHFGYDLVGTDGSRSGKSRAAGVFSCWPDGSDVRVEGQGGINPVDIAFTNNGEMLSTCAIFDSFGGRHDALIHWIRGGLTQRVYGVPLVPETGFRLPAVSRWGQVAPAGLARYRSTHFGNEFKDSLFACHFNTQKLVQVRLVAHGATFATHERDFLTSTSIDFHPADVLEDADGSLLLLDTGGWLSWGCPHSQIAKPQIKGAIYRIRRKGGDTIPDPRGLQIDWERMEPAALAHQLADLRPAVRDRASEMLVRRGAAAVAAVVAAFGQKTTAADVRKRCLWVLSRIESDAARSTLRRALGDEDAGVRQVAARSLGTLKDLAGVARLAELLNDPAPEVGRTAATALGQIGDRAAVPALFEALRADTELYLQHATTYALIEIGDPVATAAYLQKKEHPHWQKSALRILDQLHPSPLAPPMVVPLLSSPHAKVRDEARRVISVRPEWREEVLQVFSKLLAEPQLNAASAQLVEGIVLAFAQDESFHGAIGRALAAESTSIAAKIRLFASIGFMESLPDALLDPVRSGLRSHSGSIKGEALAVVLRFGLSDGLVELVQSLADNADEAVEIRVAALGAIAVRNHNIDARAFELLANLLRDPATPALLSRQAAHVLGRIKLSATDRDRASELCELVSTASPLQIAPLLQPFVNLSSVSEDGSPVWPAEALDALGVQLASALDKCRGRKSLRPSQLNAILNAFPASLPRAHDAIHQFTIDSGAAEGQRAAKLTSLVDQLPAGNGSRGRVLFHANRSTCTLCHRAQGEGGILGPDLSKIGSIRSRRDLLEAIVFPSATVVNGYENFLIETADGRSHAGLIQRESTDAVYLRNADQREQRVPRTEITKMLRAPVSAMPQGLEQIFTPDELADLIAFLESCR